MTTLTALVLPGRCHAAGCVVRGAGARTATAGETSCFHVQARCNRVRARVRVRVRVTSCFHVQARDLLPVYHLLPTTTCLLSTTHYYLPTYYLLTTC